MLDRAIRAAKVEPALYEEVENDQGATNEAATVVGIVAGASAIGAAIGAAMGGRNLIAALLITLIFALLGWVIWSYVTYFVGTRFMGGTATPGELLRTIGYAQTPGVLNILQFIPVLGGIITLVAAIWSLWAGIVAVRQALDFDTGKAVITVIIGWVVVLVLYLILAVPLLAAMSLR